MFWEKFVQDLPFYLLNLGIFITLIVVTWLWARTRFTAEIAKYQSEIAALQLQRNDQLFELEDNCKEKNERLRLILKDLRTQIRIQKTDMVNSRRNELSNVFVLDYAKSMHQYTRLADEMYEYDLKKRQLFIENQLFPFLQLASDIQRVVNQPSVLELLGENAQKIQFNYIDFDFAFDFIRAKLRFGHFGLKRGMRKHLKELGFEVDFKRIG